SRSGPRGEYRLMPGDRLPPVVLDDDEAVAAVVGLTVVAGTADPESPMAGGAFDAAAGRALAMLDRLLPERLRLRTTAECARIQPHVHTPRNVDDRLLIMLTTAIAGRILLTWVRKPMGGPARAGLFEPYRMIYRYPNWFVVGFDFQLGQWTLQRVDEIIEAGLTRRKFTRRPLPPGRADALRPHVSGEWHRAVLTIWADQDRVREALRHLDAEVEARGIMEYRVRIRATSSTALVMRLALHGIDFHVEESAELAELCSSLAERLHRAAGEVTEPCDGVA
ncbi:MAG: WYL domain-containing protein, partial [Tomitella sp.]|nr:WYL domain-containing protein [Tomitella sp.]